MTLQREITMAFFLCLMNCLIAFKFIIFFFFAINLWIQMWLYFSSRKMGVFIRSSNSRMFFIMTFLVDSV